MDSIDEAITYDDFEQRYFKTHESLDFDFSTTSIITQNLTAQYQVKPNSDSENEDVKSKNSHVPRKHEANNNSLNCHSEPSHLSIQCQLKSRFNWKSEEVMFGSSSNSSVQEEHENYDNSLISYNEQLNFNTQHEMQPSFQTSFANSSIQEKHESKNNSLTSYNGPTNLNTQRHLTSSSNSKGEEVISGCLSNSSVQEEREYNDNSLTSYSEQINLNTQHPIQYRCNLEEKEIISERCPKLSHTPKTGKWNASRQTKYTGGHFLFRARFSSYGNS
ncbi:uncharacterized protein LOC129609249 [Condylostylus longicornis]|uniref:uncharacterized protein LOC129609249 n=1 Tax=Condylostylus longicornis TaxID=2530218 RepID=UPI00244DFE01|nr:uncharacterized protein LOC129609249 [Condylostylus longicornis]